MQRDVILEFRFDAGPCPIEHFGHGDRTTIPRGEATGIHSYGKCLCQVYRAQKQRPNYRDRTEDPDKHAALLIVQAARIQCIQQHLQITGIHVFGIAAVTRSGVMGMRRTRAPTASKRPPI